MNIVELLKNLFESIFGLFSKDKNANKPTEENKPKPTDNKPVVEEKPEKPIIPKPEKVMSKTRKLYSLIVGINDYQFVTRLGGCVNDAKRINEYFEKVTKDSEFEYLPKILLDADATKSNIQDAFLNHLAKAEENDVVVYYFSGHGAQERGDAVWKKDESDGALETQVCYDSRDREGTPDLADKELRYLIHQVSLKNPHILTISDSCHSGDNTRTDMVKRRLPDDVAEPRLSNLAPMRSWDKFCFADKISKEEIANELILEKILPQGQHIQMSACQDRELAYELRGSGIFTSMFLNVLERSNGNISYSDLQQRIRFSITGKYPQLPGIYSSDGDGTRLHQEFLGGAAVKEPFYYNVQKNFRGSIGWTLSIGAIHGVPTNLDAGIVVEIRDTNDKSKILTTATLSKVEPGMTRLSVDNESNLEVDGQYYATIPNLFTNPMRVYIHGNDKGVKVLKEEIGFDENFEYANIEITDDLVLADYLVYAKKSKEKEYYFIGHPMNDLSKIDKTYQATFKNHHSPANVPYWKWLTEQQKDFIPGSARMIIKFLKNASNYHALLKLENPTTRLKNHNIEVEVFQVPKEQIDLKQKLEFKNGKAIVDCDPGSAPPQTYFYISVTNRSDRTYRVAMPALFPAFEVITGTLDGGVVEIPAGETKLAFSGQIPSVSLANEEKKNGQWTSNFWIKEFNWHHKTWYLKLIVSTENFNINDFAREAVPYPDIPRPGQDALGKGFGNIGGVSKAVVTSDWTTELFEIQMVNPFYVAPPEEFA
ncbi:MAG: caspase domain-containing protein [Saprospiraceae bacterium]